MDHVISLSPANEERLSALLMVHGIVRTDVWRVAKILDLMGLSYSEVPEEYSYALRRIHDSPLHDYGNFQRQVTHCLSQMIASPAFAAAINREVTFALDAFFGGAGWREADHSNDKGGNAASSDTW